MQTEVDHSWNQAWSCLSEVIKKADSISSIYWCIPGELGLPS